MKYPCDCCTRVLCPEKCDDKRCTTWRSWFMERWAAARRLWTGCNEECR